MNGDDIGVAYERYGLQDVYFLHLTNTALIIV
jgi:hypothetical protein